MGSATFYPAVSSDNGYANNDNEFFSGGFNNEYLCVGKYGTLVNRSWLRFALTGIPAGARIYSAVLTLFSNTTRSGDNAIARVSAVSVDNADAPSSATSCMSLSGGTQYVDWVMPNTTSGSSYSPDDMASVIQEFIDRPGYSSGDHVVILVSGELSDTGAYRFFDAIGYSGGSYKPSLLVEWYLASADCSIPLPTTNGVSGASGSVSFSPLTALGIDDTFKGVANGIISFRLNNDGLGGMSCSGTTAPTGDSSIPSITVSATAKRGTDGVMTMVAPTMTGRAGAGGDETMPTVTMAATTMNRGRAALVLPLLAPLGVISQASVLGHGAMTMGAVTLSSGVGVAGQLGQISNKMMCIKVRFSGHAISGTLGNGKPRMVPFKATGQASTTLCASGAMSITSAEMDAMGVSNDADFYEVLQYDREAIR